MSFLILNQVFEPYSDQSGIVFIDEDQHVNMALEDYFMQTTYIYYYHISYNIKIQDFCHDD